MTTKEIKKASQQALTEARIQMGAERIKIPLDEKRWEAIQAGAISESQLKKPRNELLKWIVRVVNCCQSNSTHESLFTPFISNTWIL